MTPKSAISWRGHHLQPRPGSPWEAAGLLLGLSSRGGFYNYGFPLGGAGLLRNASGFPSRALPDLTLSSFGFLALFVRQLLRAMAITGVVGAVASVAWWGPLLQAVGIAPALLLFCLQLLGEVG